MKMFNGNKKGMAGLMLIVPLLIFVASAWVGIWLATMSPVLMQWIVAITLTLIVVGFLFQGISKAVISAIEGVVGIIPFAGPLIVSVWAGIIAGVVFHFVQLMIH